MALVMDKVIEEILKYRKYKVWRCLDDNSLLALQGRDGDIATGRHPETQGLLPMEADMERGFFKVNEHFETSVPGIYAIGDIVYGRHPAGPCGGSGRKSGGRGHSRKGTGH